ncbi:CRISPR-associated protein Cas1 [Rhodospirillum centenum]|uniref:CRISPR-associated protein Cas1 n=1 Tax=Rhodospirillum centenum (strain ATCC 51521 / SW) TaxID=414684 RepID=B6ITM4_RHOCS|nr:CRISPR-associated protein Cas1 [Rhodospirillum centenum]ACI99325.1 CRISPR-associated protein Cas1 [Rhodospirillum centenum SW]
MADDVLVPARMVNEWVYCPRLAYLEWVEGEWADSGDTVNGRRTLIRAFERRLEQEVTHPVFGYQISTRRMLHVQARLLAKSLRGEIPAYPHYIPR